MKALIFFKRIVKKVEGMQDSATQASLGENPGDFEGYIDTGSYAFNAVLSTTIHGGILGSKVTALAGESGVGKTYFAIGIVKAYLEAEQKGLVVYFDTEAAVTKDMLESRGVDTSRVIMYSPDTLESFKISAVQLLNNYGKEENRPPLLFVLDSLGALPTNKELEDAISGKEVQDMTRARAIRSIFRVVQPKLAKNGVAMILTNHTYKNITSMHAASEISGGGGVKYASDSIVMLSRRREKEGKEIVGHEIDCLMTKSRGSQEYKKVTILLTYDKGLDRYYGLLPIAKKYGIFEKSGTEGQYIINGVKKWGKTINDDPEKYFTPEVLEQIDAACKKEYNYGSAADDISDFIPDPQLLVEDDSGMMSGKI